MIRHTPEPWKCEKVNMCVGTNRSGQPVYEERFAIIAYGETPSTIAVTEGGYGPGVEEANGQLLAASPRMKAALFRTLKYLELRADGDSNELWAEVAAVLSEATGENVE